MGHPDNIAASSVRRPDENEEGYNHGSNGRVRTRSGTCYSTARRSLSSMFARAVSSATAIRFSPYRSPTVISKCG